MPTEIAGELAVDALGQAGQHLAGADLDDLVHAGCAASPARFRASAPGRSPARPAARGSRPGRCTGAALTLATSGTTGARELDLGQRLGHLVGGGLHQRAMEGRAHRQHDRAPRAALGGDAPRRARPPPCRRSPPPGPAPLSLAQSHTSALRRASAATCARRSISMPSSAAIAPSPTGTARCMARPRRFKQPRRIGKRQRARRRERRIFAERMAGDESGVALRRSSPPSRSSTRIDREARRHQRRLRVLGEDELALRPLEHQAREILAAARRRPPRRSSRAVAKAPASSRPMPTACDPWPGKTSARFTTQRPVGPASDARHDAAKLNAEDRQGIVVAAELPIDDLLVVLGGRRRPAPPVDSRACRSDAAFQSSGARRRDRPRRRRRAGLRASRRRTTSRLGSPGTVPSNEPQPAKQRGQRRSPSHRVMRIVPSCPLPR